MFSSGSPIIMESNKVNAASPEKQPCFISLQVSLFLVQVLWIAHCLSKKPHMSVGLITKQCDSVKGGSV